MTKKIGVLTSGGDSSGMNAAVRAVVRTGIYHDCKMYAIQKGFEGLIHNNIYELDVGSVGGIIGHGGTFIQTARSAAFMTKEGRQLAYDNFKKHGLDALVVIGGDGSFHGLHEFIKEFGIQGIGLPGTIDNDLFGTEFTIGFDTALNTAVDCIDKLRDTATSHSRLFIVEVMGRHSGYIAAYSGIATGAENVFIPETPDDFVKLCSNLRKGQARGKKSAIIIVAEGDENGGGMEVEKKIKEILPDWDIRLSIIGHIQRGGRPSAIDRIVASRLGYESILALLKGQTGIMVGYQGLDCDVSFVPLQETWEKRKQIHKEWLDITQVLSI
ncbi:MAG: 6-phosphofructokinase [Candidatus Margulisbacteria bacterium GWF2_35_9]|nr:MAG: 6-phosphofructokinase [Candidatus Margulisbacteria bacterium GWF2_35_9]